MEGDIYQKQIKQTAIDFYPRPPGGGRHGDVIAIIDRCNFYPRPPGGGRQVNPPEWGHASGISIHALRVEGDQQQRRLHLAYTHFYPRPPGGGRHTYSTLIFRSSTFLSTPSGWRATRAGYGSANRYPISIHALRVEGDSKNGQSFCLFLRKREKNLPL